MSRADRLTYRTAGSVLSEVPGRLVSHARRWSSRWRTK